MVARTRVRDGQFLNIPCFNYSTLLKVWKEVNK